MNETLVSFTAQMMKEWFLTVELIGKPGMPDTPQGVTNKARKENWQKRKPVGVKGRAFEYHLLSLPLKTQAYFKDQSDSPSHSPEDLNRDVLEKSIEAVELLCKAKGLNVSSKKKAKIIALVYQLSLKGEQVDESVCYDMIKLAS